MDAGNTATFHRHARSVVDWQAIIDENYRDRLAPGFDWNRQRRRFATFIYHCCRRSTPVAVIYALGVLTLETHHYDAALESCWPLMAINNHHV